MKTNYKNWVPKGMIYGLAAGTAACAAAGAASEFLLKDQLLSEWCFPRMLLVAYPLLLLIFFLCV